MVTFVFSKLISLVSNLLVARAFGTHAEVDAFWAANLVSDTIFSIVAGGALASAFVPTFITLLAAEKREEAWKLASAIANLVTLVLIGLCVLAGIFAPWVVTHLLASFNDPAQQALTVHLMRIQLPAAVIFGLSGLAMGVLNSHQRFLFPALAPAMYPIGLIIGAVWLTPHFGIDGVAYGAVLGAAMHLLVQVPVLMRLPGRRYSLTLGWQFPAVRQVFLLMAPRLLGVSVVYLNFWVNTQIASQLNEGSITAIKYAFNLMMMPQAAIAQSAATAAMPTFSTQYALGKMDEIRSSLAATLRGILLLSIPASLGLILLRLPLVTVIYQRGQFTALSTQMVAWGLLFYAAGLVGHCVVEIASRAFYAMQDTRTPVMVTVAAMGLNVAFSLLFTRWFEHAGWLPLGGLALANSLATALECLTLLALMNRRLGSIHVGDILRAGGQALLGTVVMSLALVAMLQAAGPRSAWLLVVGGMVLGGLVYAAMLLLLRVREVGQLRSVFLKRFGRTIKTA